jgi:hypothetical protein
LHPLLIPQTLPLDGFFIEQRFNADASGLRSEMAPQGIRSSESSPAAPLAALFELSFANKLLLTGMQTLVTFPIVLTGESLPTYRAYKWTFISVSA